MCTLISTDKAVNPSSVMGATKRAAEMVVSQLASGKRGLRAPLLAAIEMSTIE